MIFAHIPLISERFDPYIMPIMKGAIAVLGVVILTGLAWFLWGLIQEPGRSRD